MPTYEIPFRDVQIGETILHSDHRRHLKGLKIHPKNERKFGGQIGEANVSSALGFDWIQESEIVAVTRR